MSVKLNRILLVDDDSADNFLHKRVLEQADVADDVMAVEDGTEALQVLDGNTPPPDLIFLDINMPGMNGWEFLEEYKQLHESHKGSIVVVMLTTSLNPADEAKARSILEISDFMNKPLTADRLQFIIDRHLKHQENQPQESALSAV